MKFKRVIPLSFSLVLATLLLQKGYAQKKVQHFIFFSQDRENIHEASFITNPGVSGAQITYPWKRLEPQKGIYDFSEIEEDLSFLTSKGKKLFIQIQDVTFDSTKYAIPGYLLTDSAYHGGADSQYEIVDGNEEKAVKAGWVSRRWDPAVAERFHLLLSALGKKLDGRIEGINLPETAVDFGEKGKLYPKGFTFDTYRDAIMENMNVVKKAFPNSVTILYANFLYGDSYLQQLYQYAKKINMGMGGPDIKVYRKAQMDNSYPLIRQLNGFAPTGVAVQQGNYDILNVKTGKQVTVPEILDFATQYLRLDYIFWYTQEPYYSGQVLPLLAQLKK